MIIKLEDDTLINMDKVTAIVANELDGEFYLRVQFERGSELTIFYDTEKEALKALDDIYNQI